VAAALTGLLAMAGAGGSAARATPAPHRGTGRPASHLPRRLARHRLHHGQGRHARYLRDPGGQL